jgi:hypothetical protein
MATRTPSPHSSRGTGVDGRNLGGAIGTAVLATIVTKREQFHSNIIGQSVDLGREEVRNSITELTNYFLSHGVTDRAAAQHQAIVVLGNTVKRQALVQQGNRVKRLVTKGWRAESVVIH